MPKAKTATERAEGARAATKRAVARELALVSILSRFWPAHLCEPLDLRTQGGDLRELVCLHTPAGRVVWRIDADERALFEHLEVKPNDAPRYEPGAKDALLLMLAATADWPA